jgi:molybdopterin-guanine dinucleotide biosynthesis protein A
MIIAYILAGGEGRRFGGDKLAAMVDGEAVVGRIAQAARKAGADLVFAVTVSDERCRLYVELGGVDGCLYDNPPIKNCRGPAAAIYTALEHANKLNADTAVILPGDTPWLDWRQIAILTAYTPRDGSATVMHGDGYLESLFQAHRGAAINVTLAGMRRFCGLRRGHGRPTDALRSTPKLVLLGTRLLSLSPISFAHINTRENVRAMQPKSPPADRTILVLSPPAYLSDTEVCSVLRREVEYYKLYGVEHLSFQAEKDLEEFCPKQ